MTELRQARRAFLTQLRPPPPPRTFLWRRCHLVRRGGDAERSGVLSRVYVRDREFFTAFADATRDYFGLILHVTLYVYATDTYLPMVPAQTTAFDFDFEPVVYAIDADEAAQIFDEERELLRTARWRVPNGIRRTFRPEPVELRNHGTWWKVADVSDFVLLLDGNHRFALGMRGCPEPIPSRGVYLDLADALLMADWA